MEPGYEAKGISLKQYKIAVIALLKPSQVKYKITPLLRSEMVSELFLFRKTSFHSSEDKLKQFVLPSFMSYKCFYWTLTPFYIAFKLRDKDIDLLLTYRFIPHTYYTWVVSKLINKPFIYSQIDQDVVSLHKTIYGRFFVESILHNAIRINVPGSRSLGYWQKVFPYKTINILHSTIDTSEFKPIETELLYDVIYVGVLTDLKRVMLLIQAIEFIASQSANVRFAIVGYGPLENDLKAYVREKDISENVVFLGKKVVDAKLLCRAKIFVMASSSEGLPCALMEAMACELLCVSTDVGNVGDLIIDGKTGFLFREPNPQRMGEVLLSLLKDYPQLRFVRKAAREHIDNHQSFTSATAKWDKLLSEISL